MILKSDYGNRAPAQEAVVKSVGKLWFTLEGKFSQKRFSLHTMKEENKPGYSFLAVYDSFKQLEEAELASKLSLQLIQVLSSTSFPLEKLQAVAKELLPPKD